MSFKVYFSFSTGLSKPITVQPGTLDEIRKQVSKTETVLGLETEQYRDNPKHWKSYTATKDINDELYCETVEEHNSFVMWLYEHFAACSDKPYPDGETITAEQLSEYWHGLNTLDVPVERWSRDYYVARMEEVYEALRGRGKGYSLDVEPLTEEQAGGVIVLFGQWLDTHDCRPDVLVGHDRIACSDDGGYYWCEKCGAVTEWDASRCEKDGCPIKAEWGEDEE